MGLFLYLWIEYFFLKDVNYSLKDRLIKILVLEGKELREVFVLRFYLYFFLYRMVIFCI